MSSTLEPPILPPELQESIRKGRCVAYIGSGASSGCYDPWDKLVNDLCAYCGSTCRVSTESSPDDYLDAAEDAKTSDVDKYHGFLGELFGRSVTLTNLIYRAMLSCNFKSYLTTNFDPLLAHEARSANPVCRKELMVYPHLDRQHIEKRTIYYLHGLIPEHNVPVNGSIVLSRSEFERAYEHDSSLRTFLIQTLDDDPVCFVGCRLREPPLCHILAVIRKHQADRMELQRGVELPPSRPPSRYILLPKRVVIRGESRVPQSDQEAMDLEEEQYRKLGIHTLRYSAPTEDDHSTLRRAFEDLANLSKVQCDYGWDGGGQYGT